MLAGLAAAVALLLIGIAAVSTISAIKFREQYIRAEGSQKAENTAKQEALVQLWDSYVTAARAGRMSRQPGQRFASLRTIEAALKLDVPAGRSKDELRTEAIAAVMLPDMEPAQRWHSPREAYAAAVDSSYQTYAQGDAEGHVSIRRASDDAKLFQFPSIGTIPQYSPFAFSSNGKYFMQAGQTRQGIKRRIWRLEQPPIAVLDCGDAFDFSPDGRRLATLATGSLLRSYDLDAGKSLRDYPLAEFVADLVAWNPRRPTIFLRAIIHNTYRLLDLKSGVLGRPVVLPFAIHSAVWHPEGRILAIVDSDPLKHPKIHLVDAETDAEQVPPLEARRTIGLVACFDHAGDRLLSNDWSGLWRVWDTRTGQVLLAHPGGSYNLGFRDDDQMAGIAIYAQGTRFFRFRSGCEYTKIVRRGPDKELRFRDLKFGCCPLDPDARLLAATVEGGMAIVDVVRGEEAAFIPLNGSGPICVDESGSLFTHGPDGLQRWNLTLGDGGNRRTYGPPELVSPPIEPYPDVEGCCACSRVMVFPNRDEGAIEWIIAERRQVPLAPRSGESIAPQHDIRHCAVSSDGRWAVTASHDALNGPAARVWDARTEKFERDLPVAAFCDVKFSFDDKWLMTTGGGVRLWSVGDWQEGPKLAAPAQNGVFSGDSRMLAVEGAPGVIRLIAMPSGKELAKINSPDGTRLTPYLFTRNETRLVCWADDETVVVINLGLIRTQLAAMGLDWEGPPCASGDAPLPPPVSVKLVTGK